MPKIIFGNSLEVIKKLPESFTNLTYIDPPFGTGKTQVLDTIRTTQDPTGDRVGFKAQRYHTEHLGSLSYEDFFDDYLTFLEPYLVEIKRILTPNGSFFLHLDYREVHYAKVLLDSIFGRDCFMNEIIWAYDYGGRSKKRWSTKHDTILWYAKDPKDYVYNYEAIDRIPYMAPGLVGPEKAALGKTPTDVWWQTIVPTNGKERTGYPTQKPLKILDRIIKVHSNVGDTILDCFAGSGTTGEAAARNNRDYFLVDNNIEAIKIMQSRLTFSSPEIEEV